MSKRYILSTGDDMKHFLAIIFLLMLTSCDSKQLTDLQIKLTDLEGKVIEVSKQRDLLEQQLESLLAKDVTP